MVCVSLEKFFPLLPTIAIQFIPYIAVPFSLDRRWSLGLGLSFGLAVVMGAIKYRTGNYFPTVFPLPKNPTGPVPIDDEENQAS